jgi:aminodeoxyfutalosine deaminase
MDSGTAELGQRLRALPKAELHLHLEGAAPQSVWDELASKYGCDPPRPERRYAGLPGFVAAWRLRTRLLREYDDLEKLAAAVGRGLASEGVVYAEAHFSAGSLLSRGGLTLQEMLLALHAGFSTVEGLEVRLIVDLVRDHGPERGARLLDELLELGGEGGVVGIGLGGTEGAFAIEGYAPLFEKARARGLQTVAHAGEVSGPHSVWRVLRELSVARIGHGLTSSSDPWLVEELARRALPLEVCVSSNVCLGLVEEVALHPLPHFLRAGVEVVVSSDDPSMFGTDLVQECCLLHQELQLGPTELVRLLRAAFVHAFMTDTERQAHLAAFDTAAREVG